MREIAATIEEARQTVPDIRVRFRSDCQGKAWLADVCCSTVYVSSHLPFTSALCAICDGVAALVDNADGEQSLIPRQRSHADCA